MHSYFSVLKSATEAPGLFHACGAAHAPARRASAMGPMFFVNLTSFKRSPQNGLGPYILGRVICRQTFLQHAAPQQLTNAANLLTFGVNAEEQVTARTRTSKPITVEELRKRNLGNDRREVWRAFVRWPQPRGRPDRPTRRSLALVPWGTGPGPSGEGRNSKVAILSSLTSSSSSLLEVAVPVRIDFSRQILDRCRQ